MALAALVLLAGSSPGVRAAGSERYDYDGLGRLVRAISGDGVVTEYTYDAAGNITAVVRAAAAPAPALTGVTPAAVRRGSLNRVTLTGTNLANVSVQADDREITLSRLTRTDTSLAFDLSASTTAALGASTLRVTSASGSAVASVQVRPALPAMSLTPLPIAVPPDGRSTAIDLVLSNPDDQAHVVAVSTVRPDLATVAPASITIPAGLTRASLLVTGLRGGNTELRLDSATLGSLVTPVFVLAAFEGVTTARAAAVGVLVGPASQRAPDPATAATAPVVGVVKAATAWVGTTPGFVVQGTTQTLTINGVGLPAVLNAVVEPATGLTLGTPVVAGDGRSATLAVTAAADAPLLARRLGLGIAGVALVPPGAGRDLLDVVAPQPVIESVSPIVLRTGSTVPQFEIRGRNLQDVSEVRVSGSGITLGTLPLVSSDGTLIRVGLQVAANATPGPRTVVVVSPAGSSSGDATASNTVTVAAPDAPLQDFSGLAAPLVGVVLAGPSDSGERASAAAALPVGVAVGRVVTGASPATIGRTETVTLRIRGQSLGAVDAVAITPGADLTLGAPVVNAEGTEVSLQVSAALGAALGPRRVEARIAGQAVHVVGGGAVSLLVTPLEPVLESISPNVAVASGVPIPFTVRGRNLQAVSAIRFTPADGIAVGSVTVDAEGTTAQANVTVATSAARGTRTVTLVTPAGETAAVPSPANQFSVVDGATVRDLGAPLVGVQVGGGAPAPEMSATVVAPVVGVSLATPAVDTPLASFARAEAVVVRGPLALAASPAGWQAGQSGTLVVSGRQLPAGATLRLQPADAATLVGTATVETDGSAISQSLLAGSATVVRRVAVEVLRPDGSVVPVVGADATTLFIYPGLPDVISLAPILARQGDTFELLIRGIRLGGATAVTAEPPEGIEFGLAPSISADGTELRIQVHLRDDAALGARVIRVFNRLGGSAAAAAAANTFTVFPKP